MDTSRPLPERLAWQRWDAVRAELVTGTFHDRIRELSERVGDGKLVGKVEVSQIYAHYQHEGLDLRHPRGGQAKFLEQPVISGVDSHMQAVAKTVLEPGGPADGMRDVVENVSGKVKELAPVEFDDLRRSAHPTVTDNGRVVYDRQPEQPRLTEEQLKAKDRLRDQGYAENVRHGRGYGPDSKWG